MTSEYSEEGATSHLSEVGYYGDYVHEGSVLEESEEPVHRSEESNSEAGNATETLTPPPLAVDEITFVHTARIAEYTLEDRYFSARWVDEAHRDDDDPVLLTFAHPSEKAVVLLNYVLLFVLTLHSIFSGVEKYFMVSTWSIDTPQRCFRIRPYSPVFWYVNTTRVSLGIAALVIGIIFLLWMGIVRSYFRFLLWWAQRNKGLVLISFFSSVAYAIYEGPLSTGSINSYIHIGLLTAPSYSGLDFFLLLTNPKIALRRLLLVFYVTLAVGTVVNYIDLLARANSCDGYASDVQFASVAILRFTFGGYLVRSLQLHWQKLRKPAQPAVQYARHIDMTAGAKASGGKDLVIVMKPHFMVIGCPQDFAEEHETVSLPHWWGVATVLLVSGCVLLWSPVFAADVIMKTYRLRLRVKERCWVVPPPPSNIIAYSATGVAIFLAVATLTVFFKARVGPMFIRFWLWWVARNRLFVVTSIILSVFKLADVPDMSDLQVISNKMVAPVCLFPCLDFALVLRPSRWFLPVALTLYVMLLVTECCMYTQATARGDACAKSDSLLSGVKFMISRIALSFETLYSYRFMLICVKKLKSPSLPVAALDSGPCFTDTRK